MSVRPISRRQLVAGAGAASFGLLLAACTRGGAGAEPPPDTTEARPPETGNAETGGAKPSGDDAALRPGLAEGMYGGPAGFEGAERYQYELDSEEGRAIAALRRLRQDGKAPDRLVVQAVSFARQPLETGFPKGAPSHVQVFTEETGIEIEFVEVEAAAEYQENLRNTATKNGDFDLVTTAIEEIGDFAEAGLLRRLDDFVARYQPSWTDATYGYAGGERTVALFNQYKGSTYAVAFDNDTQPYVYRADLLADPAEQAAFEDKYGRRLRFPATWDEQAEVAAFFTRPDADLPLYGSVERKTPFWGVVNWNQRFVCSVSPNLPYFNDDGSASCNSEAGVKATEEHVRSLEWSEPGALAKSWLDQYELMGSGRGFMGGTFPSLTKVVPGNPELDTANVGQYLETEVSPGRIVDGVLVRRPVVFYNICYGVNAFADPARHEAAYLFLQWLGGARVYTWLVASPRSSQDPRHAYSLADPLIEATYKPQPTAQLANIILRTAPPITIRGGPEYRDSLSEELQKALSKQQSAEQTMKNVEERWNRTTERLGVESQVEALKSFLRAFPAVTDAPPAPG